MSWISIDVDLDDVWDAMSRRDKQTMAEWLKDAGTIEEDVESAEMHFTGKETWDELEFKRALQTLWMAWNQLTPEQVATVTQLAKAL